MTLAWDPMKPRSAWRFFPLAVIGAMTVVVVVNVGMAWSALRTFPGIAVNDSFDHSNDYDKVLATAAHQAALGWSLHVALAGGVPVVRLADRDGHGIEGARVVAIARRPLGTEDAAELAFQPDAPGRYAAAAALTLHGQWDLLFTVSVGERHLHATRRVVVP
jgi:nitrogen fixation protein FixH